MSKNTNQQPQYVSKAARYFAAGLDAAQRGLFDDAGKLFEASASMYRNAGRTEEAAYVERKMQLEGYSWTGNVQN